MAVAVPTDTDLQRAIQTAASLWPTDTLAFCYTFKPKVLHPLRGRVAFRPHDYQVELLDALDVGKRPVVLKARQIGVSTTVMVQKLRRCLGEGPKTIVALSDRQDDADELVRIAHEAYEGCEGPFPPGWPTLTKSNVSELCWSNGSRLKALPATEKPGRGWSCSDIVLDEFAYWPWQQEMWRAVRATVSLGGLPVIVSTPDMEGDLFHERWLAAQVPGNWRPFEWDWRKCPEYDQAWYERERPDYSESQWAREFECQFGKAEDAVFGADYIEAALALGAVPYGRSENAVFAFGGDLAGEGRDETVFVVLDVTQRPVRVAECWSVGNAPAPVLQAKIEELAARYKATPWLDRTGIGWGIVQNLSCAAVGVQFTSGNAVTGENDAPNIPVAKLISNLVLGFEQGQVAVPAEFVKLIAGLRGYRWKFRAGKKTRFADWVDALALAWWHVSQTPPPQPMILTFDTLRAGEADRLAQATTIFEHVCAVAEGLDYHEGSELLNAEGFACPFGDRWSGEYVRAALIGGPEGIANRL